MAINPVDDREAENVVREVWLRHKETEKLPPAKRPVGFSFYHQVTYALNRAGLLVEGSSRFNSPQEEQG